MALERVARPSWRVELDNDELWVGVATDQVRYVELDKNQPPLIRTIVSDPQGVNRIILLKLDHRGDFMMATEAFRTFRDAFKDAEITLVCGSWNVGEAKRSGYFDKTVPFDFFPVDDSARLAMASREVLVKKFARQIAHPGL